MRKRHSFTEAKYEQTRALARLNSRIDENDIADVLNTGLIKAVNILAKLELEELVITEGWYLCWDRTSNGRHAMILRSNHAASGH
jgi:hypothetical protein